MTDQTTIDQTERIEWENLLRSFLSRPTSGPAGGTVRRIRTRRRRGAQQVR